MVCCRIRNLFNTSCEAEPAPAFRAVTIDAVLPLLTRWSCCREFISGGDCLYGSGFWCKYILLGVICSRSKLPRSHASRDARLAAEEAESQILPVFVGGPVALNSLSNPVRLAADLL